LAQNDIIQFYQIPFNPAEIALVNNMSAAGTQSNPLIFAGDSVTEWARLRPPPPCQLPARTPSMQSHQRQGDDCVGRRSDAINIPASGSICSIFAI